MTHKYNFWIPNERGIAIKEWRERDRDASKQIAKEKESYEVIRS